MVIAFPDGNFFDTTATGGYVPLPGSGSQNITFVNQVSATASYEYTAFNGVEQMGMIYEIQQALAEKIDYLQLFALAPPPTGGGTGGTDFLFFPTDTGTLTVSVAGGDVVVLCIGKIPFAVGSAMTASFQPDAAITINGRPAKTVNYISGIAIQFVTAATPAGTYDIVYSDHRGSVTRAACIIFS